MPKFDDEDKLIRALGRSRLMPAPVNRSNRWSRKLEMLREAQQRQALLMSGLFLILAFATAAVCRGQEPSPFRKSPLVQDKPLSSKRWVDNRHFQGGGESKPGSESSETPEAIRRRVRAVFASAAKQQVPQSQDSITQRFVGSQERERSLDPIEIFNQSAPGGPMIGLDQNGNPIARPQGRFRESGISGFDAGGRQIPREAIKPTPFDLDNFPPSKLPEGAESVENTEPAMEGLPPAYSSSPSSEKPVESKSPSVQQPRRREKVIQNYSDGKPRLVRTMAMDDEGNYYNDGSWEVFDRNGDSLANGEYRNGLMHGQWGRRHRASEGGMFATKPFTFYQGPFDSIANFKEGKLHGSWVIYDNQRRSIFEIMYKDGQRDGTAIWYFPDRSKMRVAFFKNGVLDGEVIERDADGRIVARDRYYDGRKVIRTTTRYRPNVKQSETFYLDARLTPESMDNWWEAKPTPFVASGSRVQNGPVRSWYPNQQPKYQGQYKDDRPIGQFLWWHENGNRKTVGLYDAYGQRTGRWIWWHQNGIKQFEGTYKDGKPVGLWRSWFDDGKLRKEKNYDLEDDGIDSGYGKVDLTSPVSDEPSDVDGGGAKEASGAGEPDTEERDSEDASSADDGASEDSGDSNLGELVLPSTSNGSEVEPGAIPGGGVEGEVPSGSEGAAAEKPDSIEPTVMPAGDAETVGQAAEREAVEEAGSEESIVPANLNPPKSTAPSEGFEIETMGGN